MNDQKIYRWAGICSLAAQAFFFIEFPFYVVRTPFPGMGDPVKLADYTLLNGTNIMSCAFLDFIILTLIMIFLAGFRHLIVKADAQQELLGTLVLGVGLVYVTMTLIADLLQAGTVVDAHTVPASGVVIRAMTESMYLMYGSGALFLMSLFMAVGGYAGVASRALPRWSGWVAYLCALGCLAFVPSMFVSSPDFTRFYNPIGWGPIIAECLPLTVWMIMVGILMIRKGKAVGDARQLSAGRERATTPVHA
jgi:hypothetical protein